jgi:hypothetical protein
LTPQVFWTEFVVPPPFFSPAWPFSVFRPGARADRAGKDHRQRPELPGAFDELQGLDKIVAETKAAQSSGQNTATAGQAAGVAAEVASRTGLFGSIGGLTGHLFGSVASKTAANVAEQQGQMRRRRGSNAKSRRWRARST